MAHLTAGMKRASKTDKISLQGRLRPTRKLPQLLMLRICMLWQALAACMRVLDGWQLLVPCPVSDSSSFAGSCMPAGVSDAHSVHVGGAAAHFVRVHHRAQNCWHALSLGPMLGW